MIPNFWRVSDKLWSKNDNSNKMKTSTRKMKKITTAVVGQGNKMMWTWMNQK